MPLSSVSWTGSLIVPHVAGDIEKHNSNNKVYQEYTVLFRLNTSSKTLLPGSICISDKKDDTSFISNGQLVQEQVRLKRNNSYKKRTQEPNANISCASYAS